MKHATSELPGYLSNCCRSHFRGQITSKQSADKFSHLAPCRVPMSFSKDWQIAWPVRISAFTMGWFSLLPWLTNIIPAFKHSLWFSMFCNKLSDPEMYWLLKCTISRQSTSLLYFHYPLISWKPGRLWLVRPPHQGADHCHCIHCRNPPQGSNKLPFTDRLVTNKSWPARQNRARFSISILGSKYNCRNKPGRKASLHGKSMVQVPSKTQWTYCKIKR